MSSLKMSRAIKYPTISRAPALPLPSRVANWLRATFTPNDTLLSGVSWADRIHYRKMYRFRLSDLVAGLG